MSDALGAFVERVARTRRDGDNDGSGESLELENDDAWETLCGFINDARKLLGLPEELYPLPPSVD